MPDIDTPDAKAFSQEWIRRLAALQHQMHSLSTSVVREWNGGKNGLFGNNATDMVRDANGVSHPYSGADVHGVVDLAMKYLEDANAGRMVYVDRAAVQKRD